MNMSSAQQTRKIVESNCNFLEGFQSSHKYLNIPAELRSKTKATVDQVRGKLCTSELKLAIIGGFSAGKSTLINAMLGDTLLAARAAPTTICPTCIRYGESKKVAISLTTIPRGTNEISSPMPDGVWLKASFLENGSEQMTTSSGVEYVLTHDFSRRGVFEYIVHLDELPVVSGRVYVPRSNTQVAFTFNLLTNTATTSLNCSTIPDSQLPTVSFSSAPGAPVTVLRDLWLDSRHEAVVQLPGSGGRAFLDFDADWFDSNHPVWYVERPIQSPFQRFRAWLQPSYRYKRIASDSKNCSKAVSLLSTGKDLTDYVARFDLNDNTFTVRELPDTPWVTRTLVLPNDASCGAKALATLTAASRADSQDKDYSDVIHGVTIFHPSELLRRKLVLVDTPGIAADSGHTAKTVEIIEREADACLFLLPAEQAGTLSDLDFIRKHVMSNVGDIIFVLTKADKADSPEEVHELVDAMKSKIGARLGLSDCMVLAVSAKEALSGTDPDGCMRFKSFVEEVSSFTERNRDLILVKRLVNIETVIMQELKQAADNARTEYERERARLQAYVIENLEIFIAREQKGVFERFDAAFDADRYELGMVNALTKVARNAQSQARSIIDAAPNMQALKETCESDLKACLSRMNGDIRAEYRNQVARLQENMRALIKSVFEDFETSFEEKYPLARLTGESVHISTLDEWKVTSDGSTYGQVATVDEAMSNAKTAGEAGVTIGAIVGTFILPGVGSIVGGALGFLASKLFGPSLDSVKTSVKTSVDAQVESLVSRSMPDTIKAFTQKLRGDLVEVLEAAISNYLHRYSATVKRLIEEHMREKKRVDEFISNTTRVVEDLNGRISELETLKANLRIR